jgi:putative phage-type endonuclease
MKIHDVKQQTDEWYTLREQYPLTASNAQAIGNGGKGLETVIWEALASKHSTADKEHYSNVHTDRGNELESNARSIYEMRTGNKVTTVGFITNDDITTVGGCSPDGLVSADGLVEIKCFDDVKHFKYIVQGLEPESQYMWQMQMQLLITERDYVDFVAYNPNFHDTLLTVRVKKDEVIQGKILEGLKKGEAIINEIENSLK